MIILSWVLAGAVAALAYVGWRVLKRRSHHLDLMMDLRDEFFKAATALISDDETPEAVLVRLEFMAENIDNPRVGRSILVAALSGRLREMAEHPPREFSQFMMVLQEMRQEMRHQFGIASATGLLAATYMNIWIGSILRRMLLFSVRKNEAQAELVASSINKICPPMQHDGAAA